MSPTWTSTRPMNAWCAGIRTMRMRRPATARRRFALSMTPLIWRPSKPCGNASGTRRSPCYRWWPRKATVPTPYRWQWRSGCRWHSGGRWRPDHPVQRGRAHAQGWLLQTRHPAGARWDCRYTRAVSAGGRLRRPRRHTGQPAWPHHGPWRTGGRVHFTCRQGRFEYASPAARYIGDIKEHP